MTFRCLPAFALAFTIINTLHADDGSSGSRRGDPGTKATVRASGSTSPTATPTAPETFRIHLAQAPAPVTQGAQDGSSISPAEQINRVQQAIESEEKRLASLKAELNDPSSEYARARVRFEEADKALQARKKELKDLSVASPATRKKAEDQVAAAQKLWGLAKVRCDLALDERKADLEEVANLEQMIRRDRQVLDRLQNVEVPRAEPTPADAPETGVSSSVVPGPNVPAPAPSPSRASPASVAPAAMPTAAGAAGNPAAPAQVPAVPPAQTESGTGDNAWKKELAAAQHDAETKEAESREADKEARTATTRLESLDREIALEKKQLTTARKQLDNATETRQDLTDTFRARSLAGAPRNELDALLGQVNGAERRLKTFTDEVHSHTTRLDELQSERAGFQADQLAAMHKAEEARARARAAEEQIQSIENPFRPRNVLRWLVDHGPRMLLVLLAMLFGSWISRHFCDRFIWLIAHKGARGTSVEREDRARTLVGVFYNATSVAVYLGGTLMILQEAGIPIAPLLGGAAVLGLAVAFGAQNLIRDYFYGFVILLENQYKLNDVVKIGGLSGQVEKITLRMTVLRDLEGQVHFIPNGQVTAVTNMTHGWSRALFSIGIAYKEDADQVMGVLTTLARELQADPQFGPLILEDATMLGVDELADSAVIIKFFIKTRPLQQWTIRRELLRRIKRRFDELGIEIPFPHRTVFHRAEPGSGFGEMPMPPRILRGSH